MGKRGSSQKTSEGIEENRNGGSGEVDDSYNTNPSFGWVEKEIGTRQEMNEVRDDSVHNLEPYQCPFEREEGSDNDSISYT